MYIAYGKKIILNLKDMKTLGKLFLGGIWSSLEYLVRFIKWFIIAVVVLALVAVVMVGCAYILKQCGYWSIILFIMDVVLLWLCIETTFVALPPKLIKTKTYISALILSILKNIAILLLVILGIGLFNAALWGLGYLMLLPFNVSLSIGATALIGLVACILIILLIAFVIYVRIHNWRDGLRLIVRLLGELLLPISVTVIIIYMFTA